MQSGVLNSCYKYYNVACVILVISIIFLNKCITKTCIPHLIINLIVTIYYRIK